MMLTMAVALLIGAFLPLYAAWAIYIGVAGTTAYVSLQNYVVPTFKLYSIVCLLFAIVRTLQTFAVLESLIPIFELLALLSVLITTIKVVRIRVPHVQSETILELIGLVCISVLVVVLGFGVRGIAYSAQLWGTMIPVMIFVVAIAAMLGRATDDASRLLIASTLGPLVFAIADFEQTGSVSLSIAASSYIFVAAAVGLRQPFVAADTRLRRRFGKRQLVLLLLMALLPSVAFVQAIVTSSDLGFAIASIIIGAIGSTSVVLRVALLIRGRDWTYEQEKNLVSLNEKLVLTESEDEIFSEVLDALEHIVDSKCVVGLGHDDDESIAEKYEKGAVKQVKSTISVPVPGNPGLHLYAKSCGRFRMEVEELFAKTANHMYLVMDRQAVREEALQTLRYQASHDQLTGLLNRSAFMDIAKSYLEEGENFGKAAILFIDVDRFKFVNDAYGHAIGDKLLVEIADKLVASVRASDVVARVGGDEFVILLKESESIDHVGEIVTRIQRTVSAITLIDDCEIAISPSTGVAYLEQAADIEQVVKKADTEMYKNKRDKKADLLDLSS